jgi:hypothetical protein
LTIISRSGNELNLAPFGSCGRCVSRGKIRITNKKKQKKNKEVNEAEQSPQEAAITV